MKKIIYATIAFLCLTTTAFAEKLSMKQILEATCRVHTIEGGYGTGTCINHINGKYQILTNQHVVSNKDDVTVEFFKNGYKTLPIKGKVIWRAHDNNLAIDFAIIEVLEQYFGEHPPRIIKVVNKEHRLKKRQVFITAGCPQARWARALEGHVVDIDSIIYFTPPPLPGQSGSGIFVNIVDKNGETNTRLAAIITWYFGQHSLRPDGYSTSLGGAIPIKNLYQVINGEREKISTKPDKLVPIPNRKTQ